MEKILDILKRNTIGRAVPFWRFSWLLPPIVILIYAILYATTIPPQALGGDNAEFITAAYTFGLTHPTGYPLYVLLGRIILTLFFFLPPALVMNGFSTLCFLLMLVILERTLSKLGFAPLVRALVLILPGLSPEIWLNSVTAEVYTLHGMLFALVLFLMVLTDRKPKLKTLYFLAFVAGISVGNHMTAVLMYPGLLVWGIRIFIKKKVPGFTWPHIPALMGLFLAGASVLLLIFVQDRPGALNYVEQYLVEFSWMKLHTSWERFFWVITGAQYSAADFAGKLFSLQLPANIGKEMAAVFSDNPLLLTIGTAGFFTLAVRGETEEQRLSGIFVISLLVILGCVILYFSTYLWAYAPVYFLYGYIILLFGGALFFRALLSLPVAGIALALLLGCGAFFILPDHYKGMQNLRNDQTLAVCRDFLKEVEPDAVVCSHWHTSAALWYLKYIEGFNGITVINARDQAWEQLTRFYTAQPVYYQFVADYMDRRQFVPVKGFYKKSVDLFSVGGS